jgi:hypothetical protein
MVMSQYYNIQQLKIKPPVFSSLTFLYFYEKVAVTTMIEL